MRLIIQGKQGDGKSTLMAMLADRLRRRYSVAGLITIGHWHKGQRSGYTLKDMSTLAEHRFAEIYPFDGALKVGRYAVYPSALRFGLDTLSKSLSAKILLIDEIGRWELNGHGWAPFLAELAGDHRQRLEIWGVGDKNVADVQTQWPRKDDRLIAATEAKIENILTLIDQALRV
jgi:nucleoside-triphosphatase THEP1